MNARRSQVRWLALLGATAVTLYGCWLMIRPFLGVLTWAVVLVVTFHPVHRRLASWTRRPGLAALVSSVLAVVAVLAPVTLAVLAVAREVPDLVRGGQPCSGCWTQVCARVPAQGEGPKLQGGIG